MKKHFRAGIIKLCVLAITLSCIIPVYAQNSADTIGAAYAETLSKSYALNNKDFLSSLAYETDDKKMLKYFETNFKEIFETLHEEIKDRQMADIPVITTALQQMVKNIQAANPDVSKELRVVLVRDNVPNAATLGDNTLFVNMGLLHYLQNEDQVAGVLCHEIGHLLRKHTIKVLKYNYEKDKEAKLDVKALRGATERRTDRAFEMLKTAVYKKSVYRRKHEYQADSVGYLLFKNTKYRPAAFAEALELADATDTIKYDGLLKETYPRLYDLPGQKFNEQWMKVEDFTSYNYNAYTTKFNEDSVSTHPGGKERTGKLASLFPELAQKNMHREPAEAFKKVKETAERERLQNLYTQEKYGEAVYLSMLYLQQHPDDVFYSAWLGRGFDKIYEARKSYTLNRYLDQVEPKEQSQSYIQFLSFMWNLKPAELKHIAAFYNKGNQ
jgi:Zn-dependent protease with chaperone function